MSKQNEKQLPWRDVDNSQQMQQSLKIATTQQSISGRAQIRDIIPNNMLKRVTPVLFSTNRGLHLRLAKTPALMTATGNSRLSYSCSAYDIHFCDLERWSTKANAVCLEDSFTNTQFAEFQQPSSSGNCGGNFNCTFTRFNCR